MNAGVSHKKPVFQTANYYSIPCNDRLFNRESIRDMDILKLCDALFEDEELKDIPLESIFRVAYAVLTIISKGDCFYKDDFD